MQCNFFFQIVWRVTKTKHRKKDRKQGRLIEKTKKTSFINLPSLRNYSRHFATTGFPAKWRLRHEQRNSILMTCQYSDLVTASDWSEICFVQSEALLKYGQWHATGMEFGRARFLGVISRGNHRWGRKMFSVFSGYKIPAVHANGAPSVAGGAPEPSINDIERPLKHQGTEWCVWSKQHPLFSHSSRCIPK